LFLIQGTDDIIEMELLTSKKAKDIE